jgi:alkyl sulfatase BDS1-like metallo-beta-lactamase superfamily hydrolase
MEVALSLEPELLLPGHGAPIVGKANVAARVSRYRDAILHVHDAVVRGLNAGTDVYTLMREVTLPESLRLGDGFGRVSWAVRGIYESYAGWFDGRTASMYAEPPSSVYAELTSLAGGPAALAARAEALVQAGEAVRALRLTDVALAADPAHRRALDARLAALQRLLASATNYFERAWLEQDIRATRERVR